MNAGDPANGNTAHRSQEFAASGSNQTKKEESTMAATFELYIDKAGEYRWRLRHQNGQIIADSGEGYTTKANAVNGIESVKENASGAPIKDQTV